MSDSNVISLHKPVADDPLQTILREGARQLLANAVKAELASFLAEHNDRMTDKPTVVRNGYLPERTIQTRLGDVAVKIPKTRDRSGVSGQTTPSTLPDSDPIASVYPQIVLSKTVASTP